MWKQGIKIKNYVLINEYHENKEIIINRLFDHYDRCFIFM